MGRFRFSRRAEVDLLTIADYTLHKWGKAQAARYIGELDLKAGDRVWLSPDPARLHRFDKDGLAIRT